MTVHLAVEILPLRTPPQPVALCGAATDALTGSLTRVTCGECNNDAAHRLGMIGGN